MPSNLRGVIILGALAQPGMGPQAWRQRRKVNILMLDPD